MLLIFFLILLNNNLIAQNGDINSLSVKDAIEISFQKNPALINKINEIEIAKRNVYINNSLPKPEFLYFKEGINDGDFAEERFSFNQNIDFPLKIFSNISADKKIIKRLEYELEDLKRQVISEVKLAYADLAYNLQIIEIRKKQVNIIDSLLEATAIKYEAGMATLLDSMKTDILLQDAKNKLSDAEIDLHTARYALFTVIGLDPDKQTYDIAFPDSLHYEKIDIKQDYVLGLIQNLPMYKAEEEIYNEMVYRKKTAYYDYFPDLSLSYYLQDYGTGLDYFGYEASFSVPIWFMFDQSKKTQKIEIMKNISIQNKFKLVLKLKKEIEYAWHGYDQSRKKIDVYTNNILPKSRRLLNLTLTGYREGQITLLQFLDTRNLHLNNEIQYFKELKDYYFNIINLEKYLNNEIIFN